MNVIETVQVTKSFRQSAIPVDAVRGIDLTVAKGEMVAIVGPSGSGKSTLLSLLGAIERPTSGRVLLEGTDLASLEDDALTLLRRRRIGFVFQAFNLLPTLNAVENVALPLELDGVGESASQQRACESLELVGLGQRKTHLPSMLSGGEQQRVAVAQALVIGPALVLADEPTGNLDSVSSAQITKLLRELVDDQGQTVVVVTHDDNVAQQTDRIIHLMDGVIESEERPAEERMRRLAGQRS